MSVIQSIRDKGAWIVFGIIALALIAFILQDSSFRRGNIFSNTTTVGSVNGDKISRTEFESKIDYYDQISKQRNQPMTRGQLNTEVWNYVIDQTLLEQVIDKLGLSFSAKELSDVLFGENPPQWLQQAFTDPQTGIYNAEAAREQFAQMKKTPNDPRVQEIYSNYIQPTIDQSLYQKYQQLVAGAVYIPKWMAEKVNADNNSIAKVSYVYVPYNTISDSSVNVTDAEINAYLKQHQKLYKTDDETRTITYVAFAEKPTKEDSAAVYEKMAAVKQDFINATDAKSFLVSHSSEMPFYDSYLNAKDIRQANKDSILQTPVGSVFGPYLDNNSYVLAKMLDKRQIPDSVKVRHILVMTHQQQQDGSSVRVRDDSTAQHILDSAIAELKTGKSWDSVTAKFSDDPGSKNNGGVIDYFSSGRMVPSFNDYAFTGKVGETKVVNTEYGLHYVEILGQKGSSMGYKIAYFSQPIEASAETINAAQSAANQFAANSRNKAQFDENAKKSGLTSIPSPEIKENDFSVGPLMDSRELIRWVYKNKVGDVSEPMEINNQYVVAMITSDTKAGLPNAQAARPLVESRIRNEKKAKIIIDTKLKGNTLEAMAQSSGTTVQQADSLSFETPFFPNIGSEPKAIGASFNKEIQNKVSSPIAGASGVFVIKGEGVSAKSSLGTSPETLQQTLKTDIIRQAANSTIEALRKSATIKDYRSTFY
ncbi:MAG: peptidylprolyl isomerase [Ilyomonas sp.]